jgi:protein-disulfide isomerase
VETEPQILSSYVADGRVRIVYRHLVQIGEGSQVSAEASECAGAQGQFWAMHDKLYAEQSRLFNEGSDSIATYVGFAQELGLDAGQFQSCMEQRTFQEQVERDNSAARDEGVFARPVFDVAGTRLIGAQPFSQFQQLLEAALP